jgi:rubrerythrin
MENVFNVAEVVDLGIEKEKQRRDFYDRVSKAFDDGDVKDLFTRLRDWEEGHVRKFQSIRDALKEPGPVESYPGEFTAYMNALVGEHLYQDVSEEEFANKIKTPADAIQYGIGFEKDAVLFFIELSGYVKSEYKEPIMTLLSEEKKHIVYLMELKKKYK